MKLVVTIDVEEEGLFTGRYDQGDVSVKNVPCLTRLDSIFKELKIHPTLLVTYAVACHAPCLQVLHRLREEWKAEVGAHLHPWNTPPLVWLPYAEPVPSERMPRELLQNKLVNLFGAIKEMGVDPVSFRMGRFNMGPNMFSVLGETSILVDSSIAPMRRFYGGPDHLYAPTDPYFPQPQNPCLPGTSRIMEAPITILPICKGLGSFLQGLGQRWPFLSHVIEWFAMYLGSMTVQPVYAGLRRLQAAALMHRGRGGRVLTIHFHSSELMPGGSPRNPRMVDVDGFLIRLRRFFSWLNVEMGAESLTLSGLRECYSVRRYNIFGEGAPFS